MILLTRSTEERATKDKLLGTDYGRRTYVRLGFNLARSNVMFSKVYMNKDDCEKICRDFIKSCCIRKKMTISSYSQWRHSMFVLSQNSM